MTRSFVLAAAITFSVAGCREPTERPAVADPTDGELAALAAKPGDWTDAEWARVNDLVARRAAEGRSAMPRRGSAIYRRLADPARFAVPDSTAATLMADFGALMAHMEHLRPIMKAYMVVQAQPEALELTAAFFEISGELCERFAPFLETFADDPSYAVRSEGRDKAFRGLTIMLSGLAITLQDPASADAEMLALVAPRLGAAIARLRAVTPPEVTEGPLRSLRTVAEQERAPARRAQLQRIAGPEARP
jgi:hypothetical protein